ncbi:MAG: NTP transferase domain-containing protein [Deltaproteobacteria bacterium]|nr:NTP transferase domain-containing protein [Candidatus Tharpella sp.]
MTVKSVPTTKSEKVVAFVVARLSSSRLPAKHFRTIGSKPLISWIIDQLRLSREVDEIVITTVAEEANRPLQKWATEEKLPCFWYEGEVDHVTTRLRKAAEQYGADICILVSGDCPLIYAPLIDMLVRALKNDADTDIVRPVHVRQKKPLALHGISMARTRAWQLGDDLSGRPELKEHHFPIFGQRPDLFKVSTISLPSEFYVSGKRFSVDTLADLEFMNTVCGILSERHQTFDLSSVLRLLAEKPELCSINNHVHQRRLIEDIKKVLFVIDAGGRFAYGHLMRSIELASQITERLSWPVAFMVDDQYAFNLLTEHGFNVFAGALGRTATALTGQKNHHLNDLVIDYDLLVVDIFDQRGPEKGWRKELAKKIPIAAFDNFQPWSQEVNLLLVPGLMLKNIDLDDPAFPKIISGLDYVILRREIRRLARPLRPKDIDLLVYLHDTNQRHQLETLAAKTGYRIKVLSSFDNNFPALLARSRYFLSGFGSSFYEALHLNTTPLCWPDSKAHLSDVRRFYEKIGLPVKVLQSSADIEKVLLPVLQNDSVINPKIQDGTPQIVKILAELV